MTIYAEVDAHDAQIHFPVYLRKVRSGMAFRITHRGEHVADLVPPGTTEKRDGAKAAERMPVFVQAHLAIKCVDIKALIEEGRD